MLWPTTYLDEYYGKILEQNDFALFVQSSSIIFLPNTLSGC